MANPDPEIPTERYQDKLDNSITSGGGCVETAAEAEKHRQNPDPPCCATKNTRRSTLKHIISSGLVALGGFTGISAGRSRNIDQQLIEKAQEYPTTEQIYAEMKGRTSEIRDELANKGIIESPELAQFHIKGEEPLSIEEYANGESGIASIGMIRDGEPTTRLHVIRNFGSYKVHLYCYPDQDHTFASVGKRTTSKNHWAIIDPSNNQIDSVSASASDLSASPSQTGCLQGSCCQRAGGYKGNTDCILDYFQCCPDYCYDQTNGGCSNCEPEGCHCNCPDF